MTGWRIDPDTHIALRLQSVRRAMEGSDFTSAVVETEELLDEQPDHGEALFLLGEALLELGDAEGAADAYEHHIGVVGAQPVSLAGLAIARFDLCDLPGTLELCHEAIRLQPDLAEAHYYLGLSLERFDRGNEAAEAFSAAQRLKPEAFPFPADLSEGEWQAAVDAARAGLHPALREFWAAIPVRLLDLPDMAELRLADPPITPTVGGMYEGTLPEDTDPWKARPAALRLFTRNLARCGTADDIMQQIAMTLESEAFNWLGIAPEDLPPADGSSGPE